MTVRAATGMTVRAAAIETTVRAAARAVSGMTVRAAARAATEMTVRVAARAATEMTVRAARVVSEMTVRAAARAVSGMTVRAVRADSPASTVTGTAGTAEAPDPVRDSVPRADRQPADAPLSDRMHVPDRRPEAAGPAADVPRTAALPALTARSVMITNVR